jgi:hypothetical protein
LSRRRTASSTRRSFLSTGCSNSEQPVKEARAFRRRRRGRSRDGVFLLPSHQDGVGLVYEERDVEPGEIIQGDVDVDRIIKPAEGRLHV